MFPEKIEHEPNSQQAIHPALWGGRTKLALVKKKWCRSEARQTNIITGFWWRILSLRIRETGPNFWCWLTDRLGFYSLITL
jgi:cobalamin biosynthesis protein CobD/CbiB